MTWWLMVLLMFGVILAAIVLPSPREWFRYRARRERLPERKRRRLKPLSLSWVRARPVREKPLDPRLLAGGLGAAAGAASGDIAAGDDGGGDSD